MNLAAPPIRSVMPIGVAIPLKEAVLMGGGRTYSQSTSLLVRIEADDGVVGWGEACTAPTMTGETLAGMLEAVRSYLAPCLEGENALERPRLFRRMAQSLVGNPGARAACDIALHDLAGRHLGVPVVELLGGRARNAAPAIAQLGNAVLDDNLRDARAFLREGYRWFKLKVGVKPPIDEAAGLLALRRELGPESRLCADANTGLTPAGAHALASAAAPAALDFLEQPFDPADTVHTAALARAHAVPLCADESVHDLASIVACASTAAVAGVNLKTIKLGGLVGALRAATVADALGLSVTLSSKTAESSLGATALTHLACALPQLDWGLNLTHHYLASDLVRTPLGSHDGHFACPEGPGLGIEVDEALVDRFRCG